MMSSQSIGSLQEWNVECGFNEKMKVLKYASEHPKWYVAKQVNIFPLRRGQLGVLWRMHQKSNVTPNFLKETAKNLVDNFIPQTKLIIDVTKKIDECKCIFEWS